MKQLNILLILALFAIPSFAQNQLGSDIEGEAAGDRCGYSVSMSSDGSIIAIGAVSNDENGKGAGHVRVYKFIAGAWTQLGNDIDGEASGDGSGNSISMSADGSIVAIGAATNTGNGAFAGHVRVYQYSAGTWTQLGTDIDGAKGDQSGRSVSLSADGSIVAIGAPSNDSIGYHSGQVRVYKYTGGAWTQLGANIDGEVAEEYSGTSISMSSDGSIVAIGAPFNGENGSGAGQVRVYKYDAGAWAQLGNDLDGEAAGDGCGTSISISADGSKLAIGAPYNDGIAPAAGHVRVYKYTADVWTQMGTDIDAEASGDYSGKSVSMTADGSMVAIGAPGNNGNGRNAGHARVYKFTAGAWSQLGADMDGESLGDESGQSVSISSDGNIVAIGAEYNDGNGSDAGHVRVYSLSSLLSIQSSISDINISVYPNPACSQLTIKTSSSYIGAAYSITNIFGVEMKTGKLLSDNTQLDLDDLPAGAYIIKLLNQNNSHVKVIKL